MRENIIEQIRFCATHFSCDGCGGDCKTGSNEPRTKAVLNDAADAIEELLAAVPKRGEWLITDAYPHRVYCSVCYKTYLPNADWELWSDGRIPRNFCPHCGARMGGVQDA